MARPIAPLPPVTRARFMQIAPRPPGRTARAGPHGVSSKPVDHVIALRQYLLLRLDGEVARQIIHRSRSRSR